MNRAIIKRTIIDTFPLLVLTSIGSIAFVVLFSWAMVNMGQEILDFVSKFPFFVRILEMSLGIRTNGEFSIHIMFAVCLTHLVVLALAWALIISTVTRVTVGEVELGTADLLLSLPVTRISMFSSVSLVWVGACVVIASCPMIGIYIGSRLFAEANEVQIQRFLPAVVNLLAMHWFVGGMTTLLSVVLTRRAHAIGAAIGIVIVSVTLNFIEPFLEVIKQIRFVSLLNYFRPVDVVRNETWPVSNIAILVVAAICCWIIAAAIFVRKDIPVS